MSYLAIRLWWPIVAELGHDPPGSTQRGGEDKDGGLVRDLGGGEGKEVDTMNESEREDDRWYAERRLIGSKKTGSKMIGLEAMMTAQSLTERESGSDVGDGKAGRWVVSDDFSLLNSSCCYRTCKLWKRNMRLLYISELCKCSLLLLTVCVSGWWTERIQVVSGAVSGLNRKQRRGDQKPSNSCTFWKIPDISTYFAFSTKFYEVLQFSWSVWLKMFEKLFEISANSWWFDQTEFLLC